MKVFSEIKLLQKELNLLKSQKISIGFVPTMGALHMGHLSLIEKCKKECGKCIVSIFVNPLQFNNSNDLKNYPITKEKDMKLLEESTCDILFLPSVEEMYPKTENLELDIGLLEKSMEGLYRPGHLKGMAIVVSKFFKIIQPEKAYFGEKDFQQLAVVRKLVKDLDLKIQIVGLPTKRDPNGLAISSRNLLLTERERNEAAIIYKTLVYARRNTDRLSPIELKLECIKRLEEQPLKVEYLEIADSETLEVVREWDNSEKPRAFVAAYLGKVRLIDNMSLID